MSVLLREIFDLDTLVRPEMNSWSSPPDGFELLIELDSSEYSLLIDDADHRLLIQ